MSRNVCLALGLSLSLSGCVAGAVGGGVGASGLVATVIAPALGVSATTLDEVAAASCVTQHAANVAAEIATGRGNLAWALRYSDISKVAGIACAW